MTVSNNFNRINFAGNGVTKIFAFAGKSFADTDFKIIVTADATEVPTTQTIITDYSIAIAGDEDSSTLTMVVAPAIGETLTILNRLDLVQETDLINNDGVPADTVETMVDKPVVMLQSLQEQIDRCPRLPESSTITTPGLPGLVGKAGQLVRVDAGELGYTYVDIDLEVITNQQVTALQKDIYNKVIDITAADSPYTVLVADEGAMHRVDTSTGAVTLNLPSLAAQVSGEDLKYSFVKQSGDANLVTISGSGSELISGASTRTIGTRYAIIIVIGDQDNEEWFHVGTTQSLADINVDRFSGNASDVVFTLSVDPISENNTQVYIDGAYQQKDTYSVSGVTLTFSTAPPTGTDNIEAVHIETLAIGVPADLSVTTGKIATSAVTLVKMADLAADTIIGRANGAGTGVPQALTATQVRTIINVESGATADQTNAEIKTAYEANADTNEFSDAEQTKLAGIETAADVTDATNVAAAGAVMDSDISEAEGMLRKTGAGAYEAIKTDLNANIAPTATDDSAAGFAVGSMWIDTTNDLAWRCVDATATAAIWVETGQVIIAISCSDLDTVLSAGTDDGFFVMPYAFEVTEFFAVLRVAGTGAAKVTVDVNDDGTTMLSTKLNFDATEKTTRTASVPPVASSTALANNSIVTCDIDIIDTDNVAKGLIVYLVGHRTA